MTSATSPGRGAWTSAGHLCGTSFYRKADNKPADGSYPVANPTESYTAVRLGVKAIQTAVNSYAMPGDTTLALDGIYGLQTALAVKRTQGRFGITADGVVGRRTCAKLWRGGVLSAATKYNIDPAILWGQISHESSLDPGAVGYLHSPDRGLVQINTETQDVTVEQAHDTAFSLGWSAHRLNLAGIKYSGKGAELQTMCMILQHNSPSGADTLYRTGAFGSNAGRDYVQSVLTAMLEW